MNASRIFLGLSALALWLAGAAAPAYADTPLPQLRKQGTAIQLIVDGKPFLVLGGELHNSSASDLNYLGGLWPRLKSAELNTVIAPVEWDQIEPREGQFDFTVLDGMLKQARANKMRLVLLWFGAWKNSMSTYAPGWVKLDQQRFPRARNSAGEAQDILTPFSEQLLAADKAAYAALLRHLKQVDGQRTVIMVQVENEIGMLPEVRDFGPLANAALKEQVPALLTSYLKANRDGLNPHVKSLWEAQGARSSGSWAEVFGASVEAEEVFQAWHYAVFTNALTAAGKAAYDLPMYVNVALNRPGKKPGEYPSAGPLPHLFDIWKAAAPAVDFIGIDIYFPNYVEWAHKFKRPDNPLFVPEANNAGRPDAGANAFFSIGELDAIGYSPFMIDNPKDYSKDTLPSAFRVLKNLSPLILSVQGKGKMRGFKAPVSYEGKVDVRPQVKQLGAYTLEVSFNATWEKDLKEAEVDARGGLVIQTGDNEFIVAGKGIVVVFKDAEGKAMVGLDKVTEGSFVGGKWKEGRWLNGDQTHQGRHIRIPAEEFSIQKVTLYKFR
jgi:beta-galactosidase GanA